MRRVSRADSHSGLELKFETVVEALYFEAKLAEERRGITFIEDDGEETLVSYLDALKKSYARAGVLQKRGVTQGEPVLVILPTSRDFLYLFFGLTLTGAIPCPLSPPASWGELMDFVERVRAIVKYLGARRIITTGGMRDFVAGGLEGVEVLLAEDLRAAAKEQGPKFQKMPLKASDTAFVQCTSGSTGFSKGVVLSHENLISNVFQIGWAIEVRPDDVGVSWLPLYHDMGLIGCLLFCIYWNLEAVFMSPLRFLRRPASWLEAIARHRGTLSSAPNFAYSYVASRATEEEMAGLDLSRWRGALCGAEPIDVRTLRRFEERFAACGLKPNICVPCYGLAEATLAVTMHKPGTPLVCDRIDRSAMAERGEARDVAGSDPGGLDVVSCGRPLAESRVEVRDAGGRPLPENRIGRVHVQGPSVMKGYLNAPEKTAESLKDGWLDTGDLGYLRQGALRITGRAKDLVIIRGRNYVPSDFEWAAEEVPGVRRGNAVAFGHLDPETGTEALYVAVETDLSAPEARAALEGDIAKKVADRTGVKPAKVVLLERDAIPKTSSGKLQRGKVKERLTGG